MSADSWRTGEGKYRNVGPAPDGAVLIDPTIEDGYLLLVGRQPEEVAA